MEIKVVVDVEDDNCLLCSFCVFNHSINKYFCKLFADILGKDKSNHLDKCAECRETCEKGGDLIGRESEN